MSLSHQGFAVRGHFFAGAAVDDLGGGAEPEGDARAVHGDVAAAHDANAPGEGRQLAVADAAEEFDAVDDVRGVLPRDAEGHAGLGAGGEDDGGEFLAQVGELGSVDGRVEAEGDAGGGEAVEVLLHELGERAVGGEGLGGHSAGGGTGVEDGDGRAGFAQEGGGGKTAGTGADDGNGERGRASRGGGQRGVLAVFEGGALEFADGEGGVVLRTDAGGFARVVA